MAPLPTAGMARPYLPHAAVPQRHPAHRVLHAALLLLADGEAPALGMGHRVLPIGQPITVSAVVQWEGCFQGRARLSGVQAGGCQLPVKPPSRPSNPVQTTPTGSPPPHTHIV